MEIINEATSKQRLYDDFEPFYRWRKEKERNTLDLHLNDFKKEELNVKVSNLGILKVYGEHPLNETKWSRFHKEIKISKNCIGDEIHAKFSNGILSIVMPKKVTASVAAATTQDQQPIQQLQDHQQEINESNKVTEKPNDYKVNEMENTSSATENANNLCKFGIKKSLSRQKLGKEMVLKISVVAAVVIGVYVAYKYGQLS